MLKSTVSISIQLNIWRDLFIISHPLVFAKTSLSLDERLLNFHLLLFSFALWVDRVWLRFKSLRIYALKTAFIPSQHYEHYDSRK